MTQIVSQTFTFAVPQQGAFLTTQPWTASNVPIDGSASVTVAFNQPFANYTNAVVVQYAPAAPTSYVLSTEVTNITVNGFTLTVLGGPVGATDSFVGTATGV